MFYKGKYEWFLELFGTLGQEDPLQEGIATHSSVLIWRIPWTEEPGELLSKGSPRVGQDWSDLAHSQELEVNA